MLAARYPGQAAHGRESDLACLRRSWFRSLRSACWAWWVSSNATGTRALWQASSPGYGRWSRLWGCTRGSSTSGPDPSRLPSRLRRNFSTTEASKIIGYDIATELRTGRREVDAALANGGDTILGEKAAQLVALRPRIDANLASEREVRAFFVSSIAVAKSSWSADLAQLAEGSLGAASSAELRRAVAGLTDSVDAFDCRRGPNDRGSRARDSRRSRQSHCPYRPRGCERPLCASGSTAESRTPRAGRGDATTSHRHRQRSADLPEVRSHTHRHDLTSVHEHRPL